MKKSQKPKNPHKYENKDWMREKIEQSRGSAAQPHRNEVKYRRATERRAKQRGYADA